MPSDRNTEWWMMVTFTKNICVENMTDGVNAFNCVKTTLCFVFYLYIAFYYIFMLDVVASVKVVFYISVVLFDFVVSSFK